MKQLVALIMIAFLVPTAAMAKGACKEEKAKFCKEAKASGVKVKDCLKQHMDELSAACKEELTKPKEKKAGKEGKKAKKQETGSEKPAGEMTPSEPEAPAEATPPSEPASPGGAESQP